MDRRQFLHGSLGAALIAPLLGNTASQSRGQAPAAAPPAATPQSAVPRKLVLDVHSRNLQWLRSADEVAEATIEITCGGVCATVSAYPGHIDPANVTQDLPAFVKTVRARGLRITQIAGPAITDPADPAVERRRPGVRITRSAASPTTSRSRSSRSSTPSSCGSTSSSV